ncbi:hypothetical protein BVC80_9023g6 [Macleaya cordata]|uniref:Uncharacterized protein n=1 Tax=Macleaya cordata TaxID=56857 RepID=A0A200QV15_MACCD|nr:hypothetical protein BVC80_9023g6 [Macleaya cordata]
MEEVEKLAALKKVYADIILNTAKEAAARIMVSERKALRFQQELFAAKEESLNMLLRLKQMTDCKIAEVEATSFSQRRRIEELEALLHKTEDTVTDLRSQLKGVQDELEKLKNNHGRPLDEEMIKQSSPSMEDASQVNKQNTSDSILPPDSGPKSTSTSGTKDTPLDIRNIDDNCCIVPGNATLQPQPSSNIQAENCYAENPDLASIIMRSKEPELYRNGCTQRIRAFEGNLVNGELPIPAITDDQYSRIKNESIIREEEISEVVDTELSPKDENVGIVKKKPTGLEELLQQDSSCDNGQSVKFFRRFSSRKRRSRYKTAKVNSCTDQVIKPNEPSILSRCKAYSCPENTMVESGEDLSRIVEDGGQKTSDSHLTPVSSLNTIEGSPQSRCIDGTGSDAKIKASLSVQSSVYEGKVLIDKSELSRQDSEVADSSGVPTCKPNLDTVDVPSMNCDREEKKESEATNAVPSQAVNDKLLKYTFRRKRKKEQLSCADENKSLEKNTTKRRSGEKQNVAPEPQKSSLIIESSRDSRRLVQVARQLISLSEKRWW